RTTAQHVPRDNGFATVDDAGDLIKRSPSRPGRAALVLRRAQGPNAEECSESPEHPFATRPLGDEILGDRPRVLDRLPQSVHQALGNLVHESADKRAYEGLRHEPPD